MGVVANKAMADAYATKLAPIMAELQGRSLSLRQMAGELTTQGIQTPRGGNWTAAAVRSVLIRLDTADAQPPGASIVPTYVQGPNKGE